jgi:hypothetical protein
MLKKCEYCNARARIIEVHYKECRKRKAFLKSQSKVVITEVSAEVMNTPNIQQIEIQQKPKKLPKKVKP